MKKITWTTHRAGGYVIHADKRWNNGNSPVGLAVAVRQHKAGIATGHVVHSPGDSCAHCTGA